MDRRSWTNNGITRKVLIVQYDGTNYSGWQVQDNAATIQSEIEKALSVIYKQEIKIIASGRTDTGVHAFGQVVHFDSTSEIPLQKICFALNGIMPKDISIRKAYIVPDSFHARYSAYERTYVYYIYNSRLRSPFTHNRAMWVKKDLNISFLNKAARYLLGEHDFASFCRKKSAEEKTIRRIKKIKIQKQGSYIELKITGNAFLHNMIRIIVGTLVGLSENNFEPTEMKKILLAKTREASGETAPAHGLYLYRIDYKPSLEKIAFEKMKQFNR